MWYRYHRPRRWRRGGFFFPFPFLIFLFVMNAGHLSAGFLSLLLPIVVILALGAFIGNRVWGSYQQPYQNSQSSYYNQNPNPDLNLYNAQYYQLQQPYTPYQQGYQENQQSRETYQESSERISPYPAQEQYQEYEQPQAQYPEQPPMQ